MAKTSGIFAKQLRTSRFLIEFGAKEWRCVDGWCRIWRRCWDLRVSEANLPTEDYRLIGKQVLELLTEYHEAYKKA